MPADPAMPPPPAPEDVTPDLGPPSQGSGSGMDKFRAIINHLSGGGTPAIQERLQADFAKRQHDAELYRTNAKTAATYLTHANATKSDQAPLGINPVTGQPATPQDVQQWHNNLDTSQQAYLKLLPKDAKPIAQKLGEVLEHAIGRKGASGAPAGQSAAPAIQPPPQGQAAAAAPSGPAIPPPPAASASQNAMELPPSISQQTLGAPETQRMTGVQNELAQKKAELGQEVGTTQTTYDPTSGAMGSQAVSKTGEPIGTPIKNTFPAKLMSPGMIHPVNIVGPDGQPMPALQNKFTREIYDQDGNTIPNARVFSAAMVPTQKSDVSQYNADTGVTTHSSTTRKVAGGRPAAIPAPPEGASRSASSGAASSASSTSKPSGRLAAMADDWESGASIPSAKDKPQVEQFMRKQGRTPPAVLTGPAQTVMMKTQPVLDQVNGLLKHIDDLKLGDNNTRGYLFLPRLNYATGGASEEGTLGSDIAGLSLGSVVEAASALQGSSRSIQALKIALDHTPNAWVDSPKLMKEKLQTIKDRLQDVMTEADKYGRKNLPAGGQGRPGALPPPPEIKQYQGHNYIRTAPGQPWQLQP